ncbi:MAG TPA: methyltransferase domain-containing protein [Stellaceae bacterium]|nr:methyltransferase domain-containing protein [Stellaceae bacterium]
MAQSDTVFAGSIPALYDRYLGPLIFEPYAGDLAQRIGGGAAERVLETAAGTGVLTRALAASLPGAAKIIATDLNQPMLDFAAAQPGVDRVQWQQADALALPFPDRSFDVVACQFGAMFFPDKVTAFRETLRVLQPGGRFVFSVWERIEENEFADVATAAVAALFPRDPPSFFPRIPHGYHDTGAIRADLAAAGFGRIEFETIVHRSRAASPRDAAIGLCQGTPLRNEIEARDPSRLGEATDSAEAALAARFGSGPIDGKMQALVVTASRQEPQ